MDHNAPSALSSTAADVMTAAVVSVRPEASVRDVARLLLDARISAVPVVDADGALIGMVSEGDLLGRSSEDRLAGQEWWLAIMSKPGQMEAALTEAAVIRPVRDVMHIPVVTITAEASVREAAEMLRTHGIKRLPVMHGGRMVGIVSRADLLRAIEHIPNAAQGPRSLGGLADMIGSFFGGASADAGVTRQPVTPAPTVPDATPSQAPITADTFRHLVKASEQGKVDEKRAIAHAVELDRLRQVKTMLQEHVGGEMWDTLMTHARVAAAHGQKEIELLRFPAGLCSDGARKINNADPAWAETLRGEAAEFYARWKRDLKPAGFGLAARVVDYPQGTPGDVALVLVWQS